MKLDLSYLETLNEIISTNDYFQKAKKKIPKSKKAKGFTYQYFNQICTCIVRVRETCRYIENYQFRNENICGQAFDFYEFINCASIIKSCIEVLFKVFDAEIGKYYPTPKAFKISNKSRNSDISFFNFIRSATSMHPAETTSHNKITKHKFEVYPYVIWIDSSIRCLKSNIPTEAELELLSWNCKTQGNYKQYYLVISEFYNFLNNLLKSIEHLIGIANSILNKYKDKIRCKTIKNASKFSNYSEYCLYLRKRIHSKLTSSEFPDGGLLLASHILSNNSITNEFKSEIKKQIKKVVYKMKTDLTTIQYDEIFNELILSKILNGSDANYISEKFHDYLSYEAISEIEKKEFKSSIRYEENNCNYTNAEWVVIKLLSCNDKEINNAIYKANSYCELYELILELIYKKIYS